MFRHLFQVDRRLLVPIGAGDGVSYAMILFLERVGRLCMCSHEQAGWTCLQTYTPAYLWAHLYPNYSIFYSPELFTQFSIKVGHVCSGMFTVKGSWQG